MVSFLIPKPGRFVKKYECLIAGETIRKVGDHLFTTFSKTVSGIAISTNLSRREVIHALSVLVQYRLVKFKASANENLAEYSLLPDKILLLLRYPR